MSFWDLFKNKKAEEMPIFPNSPTKAYQCIFEGRVQGVGFRYTIFDYANKLNLQGWVKNLDNGDVKAVIQGSDEKIAHLIKMMDEYSFAKIDKINKVGIPINDSFEGFEIKWLD